MIDRDELRQLTIESHLTAQKCQRNYNLTKTMPQEDIEAIISAITLCPSKQNLDYYSVIAIQNRAIIERIYNDHTMTAKGRKNPQILGQLLLLFVSKRPTYADRSREIRHAHGVKETVANPTAGNMDKAIHDDMHQAIGIAAGFASLTANMLGYRTGFNRRFDKKEVSEILGVDPQDESILMLGIGVPDSTRDRKSEHFEDAIILSFPKIPIDVKWIK